MISAVERCGVPQLGNQIVNIEAVAGSRLANRHEPGHGAAGAMHAPPKKDGGGGGMDVDSLADDAVGGDERGRVDRGHGGSDLTVRVTGKWKGRGSGRERGG